MALLFVCVAFSIIISVVLAQKLRGEQKKYHPIAGTVIRLLINFDRVHDYMTDLAEKYKTYRLIGPLRSEIYTSDPANVEYILKTNFDNYGKGWYSYGILCDLLGDGIFTVDGEDWRQQRKMSSYEFSTRVLRDFSSAVFRENAVKLANIVSEAASSDQPVNIQDLFMKAALDSIFRVAFELEADTLFGSNEEGAKFSNALDDASAMTLRRAVDISWRIKRALNIGSEAVLKRSLRVMDEFVYKMISIKTEEKLRSKQDPSIQWKKEDMLSRIMETRTETDPKYLRDVIVSFVFAGKDPTAATLSWFMYMLCKHPHVQEKVAQDIKSATNSEGVVHVSEFVAGLSEGVLEKMHYLHAALTETLRLYPAIPADAKVCFSDDTLPDGFSVKKGNTISYQPYAMGRMTSLWGDDALRFKPERWLDENGCFRQESPFKFTAFQAGPRICLGKEFAYRQMKIFSAVLLTFFTFKLSDEKKMVTYKTMINLYIDGGLGVRAFHRLDQKSI